LSHGKTTVLTESNRNQPVAAAGAADEPGSGIETSAISALVWQRVSGWADYGQPRVRVMTMHGAKGLNAAVVFIPGLEEAILPGEKRTPYPGRVQEVARQLYVSISRAHIACFVSYARSRLKSGKREYNRAHSRYCVSLGGRFNEREESGLTEKEIGEVSVASELYEIHLETRRSQL